MLVFIEICTFDLVPTDDVVYWMFAFPDHGAFNINFQTTGYESIFSIENLGLVFFILIIYLVISILHQLFRISPCANQKTVKKCITKVSSELYFNGYLMLLFEVFFDVMMATFVNIKGSELSGNNWSVRFSYFFSLGLTFILITGFVFTIGYYFYARNQMQDPEWSEKCGAWIQDLELDEDRAKYHLGLRRETLAIIFPVIFIGRRILFGLSVVLYPEFCWLHIF